MDQTETKIITGDGPEDFLLDMSIEGNPRLIISCTKRKRSKLLSGSIHYYNLGSDRRSSDPFKLEGHNQKQIRPHGIHSNVENGVPYLYVISHEDKTERIIKFRIEKDSLVCVKVYDSEEYPILHGRYNSKPNDLFVTPDGYIYFTCPASPVQSFVFKKPGLHRVYFTERQWHSYRWVIVPQRNRCGRELSFLQYDKG